MNNLYPMYKNYEFDSAKIDGKWYPRIAGELQVIKKPCDTEMEAYIEFKQYIDNLRDMRMVNYGSDIDQEIIEPQYHDFSYPGRYVGYYDFGNVLAPGELREAILVFVRETENSKYEVYDHLNDKIIGVYETKEEALRDALICGNRIVQQSILKPKEE